MPMKDAIDRARLAALVIFAALSSAANAQLTNPLQAAKDALAKAKQQMQGQPQAQQQGQRPGQAAGQPAQAQRPGQPATAAANNTPFTPPPGSKVDSTLLAVQEQGAAFTVSPHGVHMGTLSHSGSRAVIVYDGVAGPNFDRIFPQSLSQSGVVFSPDGNRYAYCGQIGNEFVVMVDGKEIYRDSKTNSMGAIDAASCAGMAFTSNSKHLYFTSAYQVDRNSPASGFSFVWDGKADPPNTNADYRLYGFSPDGEHVAYVWGSTGHDMTQRLYIDGKPAPYNAGTPQWSADSKHLYTTMGSQPRSQFTLLLDGKPLITGDSVRLFIPPVGNMAIAIVTRNAPVTQFLAIDGKPIPGSEHSGGGGPGNSVTYSADGKHYAVLYSTTSGSFVFADGQRGLGYQRLDTFGTYPSKQMGTQLAFTVDPAKVVYLAGSSTGPQFLVIGTQESDELRMAHEVSISPVGNHVLVSSLGKVLLDGKTMPLPQASDAFALTFSPDGAHYAFALREHDGIVIFLDGKQHSPYTAMESDGRILFFSPDSKHLAYFCRPSDPAAGNDEGVCLDGKYQSIGLGSLANLTFSADSNHLFWNRRVGPSCRTFADGKPILETGCPNTSGFTKELWQADGTNGLLVLGQDTTGYKRFSVYPSSSAGLNAMLSAR